MLSAGLCCIRLAAHWTQCREQQCGLSEEHFVLCRPRTARVCPFSVPEQKADTLLLIIPCAVGELAAAPVSTRLHSRLNMFTVQRRIDRLLFRRCLCGFWPVFPNQVVKERHRERKRKRERERERERELRVMGVWPLMQKLSWSGFTSQHQKLWCIPGNTVFSSCLPEERCFHCYRSFFEICGRGFIFEEKPRWNAVLFSFDCNICLIENLHCLNWKSHNVVDVAGNVAGFKEHYVRLGHLLNSYSKQIGGSISPKWHR